MARLRRKRRDGIIFPVAPDKLLFTPGPLTTSAGVKQAMQHDLGSRDAAFINVVREIRAQLVGLAGASEPEWTCIPLQGSGTFSVEAALTTLVPDDGELLILANGAYGRRMGEIARVAKLPHRLVLIDERNAVTPEVAQRELGRATHVAVVHSETTTGVVNPIAAIGEAVRGRAFIVDAMSSFGGIPLDVRSAGIDVLVSSANKCIEGVPGFGFVLARRALIEAAHGRARSLSLDLSAQLRGLDQNAQFRFTPPTHALLAFHRALVELREEGGIEARARRYRTNAELLTAGMAKLGFQTFLPDGERGYIITSFRYPKHPAWRFEQFYAALSERGFVIYPGKVSDADCFRIGSIGQLHASDVEALLAAVADVLRGSGIQLERA
jgi:2-aminoethylphosphonate-pyruvate transaminase